MNDKMYEKLLKLSDSKTLVSIYNSNENPENFNVGFIVAIDESDIVIQHIAPNGFYDGYILKKTESVFRIEYDGQYQEKIKKLYNIQMKKHDDVILSEQNLVISLLKLAQQNNHVVSLELNDSGVMNVRGFVLDVDTENANISLISEYGKNDGNADVDTQNITRIDCDTDEEQALKLLSC